MLTAPNRLIEELEEIAGRYSKRSTEHTTGCCLVCRRALRDLFQSLMDEGNWAPEAPQKQLQRMQDEITALRNQLAMAAAVQPTSNGAPVIEPEPIPPDDDEGPPFNPPPPFKPRGETE